MKIIVILGIHGAGKGEQVKLLLNEGFVEDIISTGEAYRTVLNEGSRYAIYKDSYGKYVGLSERGFYVPDDVTIGLVRNELIKDKKKGFKTIALDGFPRTLPQAEALLAIMKEVGGIDLQCIYLNLPDEVALERLRQRSVKERRADDAANVQRIALYHRVTDPALRYLRETGVVKDVDDRPGIKTVHESIISVL
jgi:adenylate kinase